MDVIGGGGGFKREAEKVRDEVEVYDYEKEGVRKHGKKKPSKKQIKIRDADEDLGSLFGDTIVGKLPKFANRITLKVMHCNFPSLDFEMVDIVCWFAISDIVSLIFCVWIFSNFPLT